MSSAAQIAAPSLLVAAPAGTRWFSSRGCVVRREDRVEVFVGGTLVSSFAAADLDARNVAVVGLAEDPKVHLGRLAEAFDIADETLRQLRRAFDRDGVSALVSRRRPGGGKSKITPAVRRRLEALFAEGKSVTEAHAAVSRRHQISRSTVGLVRKEWNLGRQEMAGDTPVSEGTEQLELPADATAVDSAAVESPLPEPEEEGVDVGAAVPTSAPNVQHAGTLLLIASVAALGLHEEAAEVNGQQPAKKRVASPVLRVAIDAVIATLALGEPCVEGVGRLATSTAAALLIATAAPSASWVRRTLGRLAAGGGVFFHLRMAHRLAVAAAEQAGDAGPVFYVDNHMRRYTGKHTLRKGWKMQEKRAVPGTSDYYLHDEDGRPVGRVTAPDHGSLTEFLSPIAHALRLALGDDETILLAFDRAGAFPEQMAEFRESGFEFVTYERKPYQLLPASSFTEKVVLDDEEYGLRETRTNLGKGRGRVRRLALRTAEGRQVNLLAISTRPAAELVAILRRRWNQENGFKHGVERWGINQLDGRTVEPYEEGTVIPNPARRRLDRALRLARSREGQIRSELARVGADSPRREQLERDLTEAMEEQATLEAQRPSTPAKAPVEQTELAGKLVRHDPSYKFVVDTVRIACANAESDLAAELGTRLPRAAEAKKTLANLLAAPGRVSVSRKSISITLHPAGSRRERKAFALMLEAVTRRRLTLPGDPERRPVRFYVSPE